MKHVLSLLHHVVEERTCALFCILFYTKSTLKASWQTGCGNRITLLKGYIRFDRISMVISNIDRGLVELSSDIRV